jgi:hypothetical protein
VLLDALRDLWGPGLVFLALCIWLIRRVVRAARTESQLEEERLRAFAAEATPHPSLATKLTPVPRERPAGALDGADVRGANPDHLDALAAAMAEAPRLPEPEVPWVRSAGSHVAWCERRRGASGSALREVICVAEVQDGKLVGRWQFG